MQDTSPVELVEGEHIVQFYDDDLDLIEAAGSYLAAGLSAGEAVIVIASRGHREALLGKFEGSGLAAEEAVSAGRLVMLDAGEVLSRFMSGGSPDRSLFRAEVGSVVREASKSGRPVRAFGEMVALLWDDDNVEGAVRLEGLWNELGREVSFGLFCAYPMRQMAGVDSADDFERVCRLHGHVVRGAPDPPGAEASRRFVASGFSARLARRYVEATLDDWGCSSWAEDALIAVSELAANAVRYAGAEFTVGLSRAPGSIRLAVGDASPDPPAPQGPTPMALGGRGLWMVQRLGADWGFERINDGKVVWVDLPGHGTAAE